MLLYRAYPLHLELDIRASLSRNYTELSWYLRRAVFNYFSL